jgi:TetR/AcrR family transcriptional regulator, transcriptional repressor for nem operon
MASDTVDRILDAAEAQARIGGYNAFSFREIGKDIGIKSASIHYHFPTKEDLSLALVQRYTARFMAHIELIDATQTLANQLNAYIDVFRQALVRDQKMCLCGVLGVESDVLPIALRGAVADFFRANLAWLTARLQASQVPESSRKAARVLATVEGALLLGKSLDSTALFDDCVDALENIGVSGL